MGILIGGIQRFSIEDGPGIRSTVFFKGCPLSCLWCHNPELIGMENQLMHTASRCIGCGACVRACPNQAIGFNEDGFWYEESRCAHCFLCAQQCCTGALHTAAKEMEPEEIMEIVERDRGYYEKTGGGVTFSGGECTMQYPFLNRLIELAKEKNLNVALDTSGFCAPEHMWELAGKSDWILYDMKCMDEERHRKLTGVSNKVILENLVRLSADDSVRKKIIIRMPLIRGVNDMPELMKSACDFFSSCGFRTVNFLPYHMLGIAKYKSLMRGYQTFEAPEGKWLEQMAECFRERGIDVSILTV